MHSGFCSECGIHLMGEHIGLTLGTRLNLGGIGDKTTFMFFFADLIKVTIQISSIFSQRHFLCRVSCEKHF